MRLFVHIGCPKSGTTTLQENLFAAHPGINCLGRPNHQSDDYRAFRAALTGDGLSADAVARARAFLERAVASDKVNILSDETLSLTPNPATMLERLAQTHPSLHIVLTIRNQYDAIRSIYVNHGQILKHAPAPHRGRYVAFDDFLSYAIVLFDAGHRGELAALDYDYLYELSVALFGADRVHVLLFEEMASHPDRFALALSRVIGIPHDDVAQCLRSPAKNPAASRRSSAFNKYRSMVPFDVSFSRLLPGGHWLSRRLHHFLDRGPSKTEVAWSAHQRNEVARLFGAGNRRLAVNLGLELDRLEYPLDKVLQ